MALPHVVCTVVVLAPKMQEPDVQYWHLFVQSQGWPFVQSPFQSHCSPASTVPLPQVAFGALFILHFAEQSLAGQVPF
jgi:hypothetical protein